MFKTPNHQFLARMWKEGDLYVAEAFGIDVASQGESHEEALKNLQEALELHFEPPVSTVNPHIIEVRLVEAEEGIGIP